MTDLLNKEAQIIPEILRRLAAGERLGVAADQTERTAAILLAAEALEKDAEREEDGQQKTAILEEAAAAALGPAHLGLAAVIGALGVGPLRRLIHKLRGEPEIPEHAAQLLKSFRQILEERRAAEQARKKLLAAGLIGAGTGALATRALLKKDEPVAKAASAEDEKEDLQPLPQKRKNKNKADQKDRKNDSNNNDTNDDTNEEKESSSVSPASVLAKTGRGGARAVLDRVLRSLA